MKISDISIPSIYQSSADFRFFLKWFDYALSKLQYDITNTADLYDALRCPKDLLWMLGDTIGYQYDDRLCAAFNRFVILYFMSMIKYKGSQLGVTLAAEVNLKQKDINAYGEENEILYNRLEDTSIPNNSVYVESNVDSGYINIIYFTDKKPIDTCVEYVRPLGMYCFQYAGVKIDSATKISIDARLANASDATGMIGPTKVGKYTRNDYARLQKMTNEPSQIVNPNDTRDLVYSRNSKIEGTPKVSAGYRALSSLQMANNEHIVKSLFSEPIFNLGYGPLPGDGDDRLLTEASDPIMNQSGDVITVDGNIISTIHDTDVNDPKYNLKYNKTVEEYLGPTIYTLDPQRQSTPVDPKPKVNNIMKQAGDAMDQ